jgi:hypothetical protein
MSNPPQAAPFKPVKADSKATDDALKKIQANFGNAKAQESKVIAGKKDEKHNFEEGSFQPAATLYVGNCESCEYTINAPCTKVLVESCKNVKLHLNAGVTTNMLELWRCISVTVVINTKLSTIQLDLSKALTLQFAKRELYHSIIWAGVHDLKVNFQDAPEHVLDTGYQHMKVHHPNLQEGTDQFIVRFVDGKLVQEPVLRLANGYPSTKREMDLFDADLRRKDEYMRKRAEDMIKLVPNRYLKDTKVGRNDPCPCKSGQKYKKCCGAGGAEEKTGPKGKPAAANAAATGETPTAEAKTEQLSPPAATDPAKN